MKKNTLKILACINCHASLSPVLIPGFLLSKHGQKNSGMHKIVVALLLLYLKSIEERSPSGCILFNMPPEVMEFAENNLARQFIKKYPDNETYTINGKPITSFKQQSEEINMLSQNTRPYM